MKSALILGVGGFVGKYLVDELREHGYRIIGSDVTDAVHMKIQYKKADITDAGQVADLMLQAQPDVVVNLAAISSVGLSWEKPHTTMQVNVVGAIHVLECARNLIPAPKVMLIGSSEEYVAQSGPISETAALDGNNPYGISKITQENFSQLYRKNYHMKVYTVRAFSHTGVGQRETFVVPSWCKQAAEISCSGKPGIMKVGNVNVKRDFSDVRDVVRAYRMILESDDCSTVYNVGSGQAIALEELLAHIVSLSEQPIRIEVDPSLIRPADTPEICCDHSLITRRLGWEPKYSVFETIDGIFQNYKQSLISLQK